MNRVAIIVLNWNGIGDTLTSIESLLLQTYSHFKIVVVENGSTDDSKTLLQAYQRKHSDIVEAIYNTKNFGFAGGVNTGIEWAINNNYEYVALFNSDAVADKEWLEQLVEAAKPKEVGISTGLLLHADGKTIDTTGDWYSTWGLAYPRNRGHASNDVPEAQRVFGATGGASLYKTALFRDIGLFDEDFFLYYEDVDVSFRAQLAGWQVAYTPKAIGYHKQGAASGKVPGLALRHTFKNLPLLFIKNVPTKLLFPIGVRFYFAYLLIFLNAVVHGSGIPATRGVVASFFLGFKKLPERWSIQRHKRVSAKYIKSILWNDLPPDQTGMRKLRKFFTGKS